MKRLCLLFISFLSLSFINYSYSMDSLTDAQSIAEEERMHWSVLPREVSNYLAQYIIADQKPAILQKMATASKQQVIHEGDEIIQDVGFSGDGRFLAVSFEGSVKIYDMASGKCISILKDEHNSWDFKLIRLNFLGTKVIIYRDSEVTIWDIKSGVCTSLKGHIESVPGLGKRFSICSAEFSWKGDLVVTTSEDGTAKIWDVETGECIQTLLVSDPCTLPGKLGVGAKQAKFNAKGDKVVTRTNMMHGRAQIWDVKEGICLQSITHKGITEVQFNKAGTMLLTGSWDGTVNIWDVATGYCSHTFENVKKVGPVICGRFDEGATRVVVAHSACSDGLTKEETAAATCIWNIEDGQLLINCDSRYGQFWDWVQPRISEKVLLTVKDKERKTFRDKVSGKQINDNELKVWDVVTGGLLLTMKVRDAPIHRVVMSPDNRKCVTIDEKKGIKISDLSEFFDACFYLRRKLSISQAVILQQMQKEHFTVGEEQQETIAETEGFNFVEWPQMLVHYQELPEILKNVCKIKAEVKKTD